jgi:hypothetical protein
MPKVPDTLLQSRPWPVAIGIKPRLVTGGSLLTSHCTIVSDRERRLGCNPS